MYFERFEPTFPGQVSKLTSHSKRHNKVVSLLSPQVLGPQDTDYHQQVAQHGQQDDHQEQEALHISEQ